MKTQYVEKLTVTDPDTLQPREVVIVKQNDGSLVGIDADALGGGDTDLTFNSPYDHSELLDLTDILPQMQAEEEAELAGREAAMLEEPPLEAEPEDEAPVPEEEEAPPAVESAESADALVDALLDAALQEYAQHDAHSFIRLLKDHRERALWREFAERMSPEEPSSDKEARRVLAAYTPEEQAPLQPLVDKFLHYVDQLHVRHDIAMEPPKRYRINPPQA